VPPPASWWPAYVGLGSNLDDPPRQLERAFAALAQLPQTRLVLRSPWYRTAPFGPVIQPHFLNAVAGLLTRLAPEALLQQLRAIEQAQGREAVRERWGPRPIDLDLLVHGRERRSDVALTLPHPGIPERNFVLYPLRDLAPDLEVPGLGTVRELAARVTAEGIERHVPATGAMTTT
jgi:2-amino-4-hydroxy-6-hydroxymethyldihydropteridine diphosphokinase